MLKPHYLVILLLFLSPKVALAVSCFDLEGASIYAENDTYLGFFGGSFATESVNNQFGLYGSSFSISSVRNQFSLYGSQFGVYSANNPFTVTPPRIIKNGQLIGYLTTNSILSGGISLSTIDNSCSFFSVSPTSNTSSQPVQLPQDLAGLTASDGAFNDRVLLSWEPSLGATSYEVYSSLSPDGQRNFIGSTTSLFMQITGLVPSLRYYFFVFPSNTSGSSTGLYDSGYSEAFVSFIDASNNSMSIACIEIIENGTPALLGGSTKYSLLMRWDGERFHMLGLAPLFDRENCLGTFEVTSGQLQDRVQLGASTYDLLLQYNADDSFSILRALEL